MNKRIQKLAEQASLYARSDNSSMLFENYHNRYTEKFAELIIEACNQYALRNWEHGHLLGQDLKIYFGVEE